MFYLLIRVLYHLKNNLDLIGLILPHRASQHGSFIRGCFVAYRCRAFISDESIVFSSGREKMSLLSRSALDPFYSIVIRGDVERDSCRPPRRAKNSRCSSIESIKSATRKIHTCVLSLVIAARYFWFATMNGCTCASAIKNESRSFVAAVAAAPFDRACRPGYFRRKLTATIRRPIIRLFCFSARSRNGTELCGFNPLTIVIA